jgi:hypothetical protein
MTRVPFSPGFSSMEPKRRALRPIASRTRCGETSQRETIEPRTHRVDVIVGPSTLPAHLSPTLRRYEFATAPSAELTTISDRVLSTIALSSACSSTGTLNLSSVC